MPATFMWARGMTDAPVSIKFEVPDGWDVATQLFPTDEEGVYTAPDFAYFMDSPTHIGPIKWRMWDVEGDGKMYTLRIAIDHDGTDAELDDYTEKARKIVAEQFAMWRDIPDFETGTYTFIVVYLPYADGDGMEHRNSTIVVSSHAIADGVVDRLGTVSHEFFHAWNVERMRPATLEPFDFEKANMSRELWFAEGFTSYYTDVFIRRAGLIDDAEYADYISWTVNAVLNDPGRRFFSAIEMSMQAPFVDAATSVDPQNKDNTFISYYTWGSGIGLALDLTLRTQFDLTLDDLMRAMWAEYGVPERPYVVEDIERKLGELTDDPVFAADFFDRYIRGHEAPDYQALLAEAGFEVRLRNPGSAWLGADVTAVKSGSSSVIPAEAGIQSSYGGGVVINQEPLIGSPLYGAGLARRDRIVTVNGRKVTSADYLKAALSFSNPGDTLKIGYVKRGVEGTVDVVLTQDPTVEVVTFEEIGRQVPAEATQIRSEWLGSSAVRRPTSDD
jgi:predicted metalloprotease with PDZ domain